MIVFQSASFELDLSKYGLSLNEKNDIFTNDTTQSFSLPFTINGDRDILQKLGLPTLQNIRSVESKFKGNLLLVDRFYQANLYLGEVVGDRIECTLVYSDKILEVLSTKLKDLPWPKQVTADLPALALTKINQEWPAVAYTFPMLYKPSISEESNYELFEGFVNNFESGAFLENEIDATGPEDVYINRNVLTPFPYLLEILKFGYQTEKITAIGDVFENPTLKKALYVPDGYLERFDGSQYSEFSFAFRDSVTGFNPILYNVYEHRHTPNQLGTYDLDIKINLDPVLASFFQLTIYREDALSSEKTTIKNYSSVNNRVHISEKLTIEVTNENQYDPFLIVLKLKSTDIDISEYNNFEINYTNGKLNVFPSVFSLSDFMPDMTFEEYVNFLENWLNIEKKFYDGVVEFNFIQDKMFNKNQRSHRHLEIPEPSKLSNQNRFYKLKYDNSEEVFYNRDGQIYSDLLIDGTETIILDMEVQPVVVESNNNVTTAVYPENESKLTFCLYDGLVNSLPVCNPDIRNDLSLQNVFENWWKTWLSYRLSSYSFKETFTCSINQIIDLQEISFKYNELHIIKEKTTKYLSETIVKVDVESETF